MFLCCAKKIMPPTPCRLCLPWNRMFLDSRDLGPHPKLGLRVYVEPSTGDQSKLSDMLFGSLLGDRLTPFGGSKHAILGMWPLGRGGPPSGVQIPGPFWASGGRSKGRPLGHYRDPYSKFTAFGEQA